MDKFDMHFHSTISDGKDTPKERLIQAKEKGLGFITLTDHDKISTEAFIEEAGRIGIESLFSTEISTRNYHKGKSLHLTYYSNQVSEEVIELLDNTIIGKISMIKKQVLKLEELGYDIELQKFYNYFLSKGKQIESLNKFNIAQYLFLNVNNKNIITDLMGGEVDIEKFFIECLKEGGKYFYLFEVKVADYEPDIEIIGDLAIKNKTILSIAHPNFTFKEGIEEFKQELKSYVDRGVNAIEINSKAKSDYIKEIYELKQKYNLILTAGSDNHNVGFTDSKHGDFGVLNQALSLGDRELIYKDFRAFLN